jgi:hypothetical protein
MRKPVRSKVLEMEKFRIVILGSIEIPGETLNGHEVNDCLA